MSVSGWSNLWKYDMLYCKDWLVMGVGTIANREGIYMKCFQQWGVQ